MWIERRASTSTELFIIRSGPHVQYMTRRGGQLATMRVRRIEFTFVGGALVSIKLTGPRLRDDGTEITWETPTHTITYPEAASTPEWLLDFMTNEGWTWQRK